jgi:hypothetical protein
LDLSAMKYVDISGERLWFVHAIELLMW